MSSTAAEISTCMLPLKEIRLNGGTQMRDAISQDTVQDYAEVLDELPPVVVFDDGKQCWLADGFHRVKAAQFARRETIQCEVHKGTRREAVLYAVGANASHGLRRSNGDKRKAIMVLLSDKEWSRWSNREIARQCQVSRAFVDVLRRQLEGPSPDPMRRRLAPKEGRIISQPVERKQSVSSNENGENGHGKITCPFCKRQFKVP